VVFGLTAPSVPSPPGLSGPPVPRSPPAGWLSNVLRRESARATALLHSRRSDVRFARTAPGGSAPGPDTERVAAPGRQVVLLIGERGARHDLDRSACAGGETCGAFQLLAGEAIDAANNDAALRGCLGRQRR
jgi:hypothetical protein